MNAPAEQSLRAANPRFDASREIRAPRGAQLSCRSWLTEAAYRMIQNNLDPDVAENPKHLVVYGGIGRAARNWQCFDKILEALKQLEADETLLIQSGKPVGVFKTHTEAPRVLLANSNLVPKWANWEHFNELDRKGLFMYGQMTAGSWIYIGSQGIVQGTYETFAEAGPPALSGGDMGEGAGNPDRWSRRDGRRAAAGRDALPEAASLNDRVSAGKHRFSFAHTLFATSKRATSTMRSIWITQHCTARRSGPVDWLARQRSRGAAGVGAARKSRRHRSRSGDRSNLGARPGAWLSARQAGRCRPLEGREQDASQHARAVNRSGARSCAKHVQAMLDFQAIGAKVVDYGNNIRQVAHDQGVVDAFAFPGFVPAYIRPLFCEGRGPFRWVALSGDPEDIYETDAKIKQLFPQYARASLARHGARAHRVSGTAGADLLARPRRATSRGARVQRDGAHR